MSEFFVHPKACIEDHVAIGSGTRVWAFTHVLSGAAIGKDCNICDHTFIEGGVTIGDRVTIKCGVSLWDGLIVEDDVFIGPNAVFTNDSRPRSRRYPCDFEKTLLKQGCSIGANSTILPGLTVGCWALIGAGAVVTRNVPDFGLVIGSPARWHGWVCRCAEELIKTERDFWTCHACGRTYQQVGEFELTELSGLAVRRESQV